MQESKQLLPQLHKPLHLSVNVSDFVTLIVPYVAPGRRKEKICLENTQEYAFISLFYPSSFFSPTCVVFSDQMCSCITSPLPNTLFPLETPQKQGNIYHLHKCFVILWQIMPKHILKFISIMGKPRHGMANRPVQECSRDQRQPLFSPHSSTDSS